MIRYVPAERPAGFPQMERARLTVPDRAAWVRADEACAVLDRIIEMAGGESSAVALACIVREARNAKRIDG